jgi:pimeloyl-ACP methyl ester carboxylesterase
MTFAPSFVDPCILYDFFKRDVFLKFIPLWLGIALLSGCVSSSPVKRVHENYWSRQLTENALTSKHLSEQAIVYLALRGWEGKALNDGSAIASTLRNELCVYPNRMGLVVLAELAYFSASRSDESDLKSAFLLTATRASYAALFDQDMGRPLNALDPNLRFAADLYNYSLSQLVDTLLDKDGTPQDVSQFDMIEGQLVIKHGHGIANRHPLEQALVAFSYKTDALRHQNRRRGIGVPIVRVRADEMLVAGHDVVHPPVREIAVSPATVLLRFSGSWLDSGAPVEATTELWNPLSSPFVTIRGADVPLEADTSLSLALIYENNDKYRGLLNMPRLLRGDFMADNRGLYLLEPYDATKIPVLFTHGLMDTALTWVPMINEFLADPVLTEKYQFWVFSYPTMNPILQSASELRQSLLTLYEQKAAIGEAWDDMVLVGHSMGGLITRLMITDSTDDFTEIDKDAALLAKGDIELQRYLKSLTTFKPLPFVNRAVFMATPHRGAGTAARPAGRTGSMLMNRPTYMYEFLNAKAGRLETVDCLENGIDNLSPESLFTVAISASDWDPTIIVNSVMGDLFSAGKIGGGDGVVAYESAHVEGAESGLVIRAGHMVVNKKPSAIAEVRRILMMNLDNRTEDAVQSLEKDGTK